jgi:hypothetical protein
LKKTYINTGVFIFGPAALIGIVIPRGGINWTNFFPGSSPMATAIFNVDRTHLDNPWYFLHERHIGKE